MPKDLRPHDATALLGLHGLLGKAFSGSCEPEQAATHSGASTGNKPRSLPVRLLPQGHHALLQLRQEIRHDHNGACEGHRQFINRSGPRNDIEPFVGSKG